MGGCQIASRDPYSAGFIPALVVMWATHWGLGELQPLGERRYDFQANHPHRLRHLPQMRVYEDG